MFYYIREIVFHLCSQTKWILMNKENKLKKGIIIFVLANSEWPLKLASSEEEPLLSSSDSLDSSSPAKGSSKMKSTST